MGELAHEAFAPVNLVYTILMMVLVGYWIIALLGFVDHGLFHADMHGGMHVDGHVDMHHDLHVGDGGAHHDMHHDMHGDVHHHEGFFSSLHSFLGFFNFGQVPVMFSVSIVVLVMWINSVQLNYLLSDYIGSWNAFFAFALFVPNLIFGLFVAKFVTAPFKHIAAQRQAPTQIVGRDCTVVSYEVTSKVGQCEVPTGGSPIRLHARTRGGDVLRKGERGVVVEQVADDIYIIARADENATLP